MQIPDSLSGLLGPTSCCWYRLHDPLQIQKRPTDLWSQKLHPTSVHRCLLRLFWPFFLQKLFTQQVVSLNQLWNTGLNLLQTQSGISQLVPHEVHERSFFFRNTTQVFGGCFSHESTLVLIIFSDLSFVFQLADNRHYANLRGTNHQDNQRNRNPDRICNKNGNLVCYGEFEACFPLIVWYDLVRW